MTNDKSASFTPFTAKVSTSGQGVAMIADQGAKVGLNDFNGGRSVMSRGEDGLLQVRLSDSLKRGRPNEPSVLDVLRQLLTGTIEKGEDRRGQDGLLHTPDGEVLTIQIVTVPPEQEINRQIGTGQIVEFTLTDTEAAEWIAMSIVEKRDVASANWILALDARPFPLLADAVVVARFREWSAELPNCGFKEIWLVGPTAARSVRLY